MNGIRQYRNENFFSIIKFLCGLRIKIGGREWKKYSIRSRGRRNEWKKNRLLFQWPWSGIYMPMTMMMVMIIIIPMNLSFFVEFFFVSFEPVSKKKISIFFLSLIVLKDSSWRLEYLMVEVNLIINYIRWREKNLYNLLQEKMRKNFICFFFDYNACDSTND